MPDFVMKQGDTLPTLTANLLSADDSVPDLTGANVMLHIHRLGSADPALEFLADIVDIPSAKVQYVWTTPQDLDPGLYYGEWEVLFADGTIERFPNDQFFTMRIVRNLA